jgi:Protein of unknown function (DUF1569)
MLMARHTLANEADQRQIVARLEKIQPTCARRWGVMTPHEMVCHLSDSFLLAMGEKAASPASRKELPAPLPRGFLKWFALQVPLPWPQGVPTRPEMDPQRLGTRPTVFDADLRTLLAQTRRFTRQPRDFSFAQHPIFGAMTEPEWMRWGYLHTDHHLRQFGL